MFAAMAPDFDTVAFKLGIAYADQFGHRLVIDLFDVESAPRVVKREATLPVAQGERDVIVSIDAGHGGDAEHRARRSRALAQQPRGAECQQQRGDLEDQLG